MKISQWLMIAAGIILIVFIFKFGKKTPPASATQQTASAVPLPLHIDTILAHAKESLRPDQITRIGIIENSVIRGDVKSQKLEILHQLSHFWKDSTGIFEPYAWYQAEAARLEDSEKSLTFAAHLFLNSLQGEQHPEMKKWKAMQAKDLFERSLKINNNNDSSIIGLGASYILGGITDNPMEGVVKVRQVADRDSSNVFAQMVLGQGSMLSGQYDKAIDRFEKVVLLQPDNLEAVMRLADIYERINEHDKAVTWYRKSLLLIKNPVIKIEIENRIKELSK